MDGLSGVASVIAVLQLTQAIVSALSEYYQSARGAHKEIKSLAATLASLEVLLKRHEEKIGSVTSSSVILDSLRSELNKLREKLEPLEGAAESKHSLKSLKITLKWPFKKDDVAEKTERIENLKTALVIELGIDTLDISRGNSTLLAQLAEKIRLAQDDKQRRSVVSWLSNSVPDTSAYHAKARQRHEKTTGEWVTSSEELQEWLTSPNSFLWLKGGAGAGKTILCSTIINYLQDHCEAKKAELFSVVAYWYFSFTDEKTQDLRNFLCSIVRDLCSQTLHLPDAVLDLYAKNNNGQQRPTTEDLLKVFRSLAPGFDHVYLVADALDECPQSEHCRDDLLKEIHEITESNLDCLHFLATSRDEIDIRSSFSLLKQPGRSFAELAAKGARVQKDIKKFLEAQLRDSKYAKWSEAEKFDVTKTLVAQADGMFRLVALQLNILCAAKSPKSRREALKQLPQTLDEVYDRMMENVLEQDKEMVRRAFVWLAFSARPITLGQLMEAIVVEPADHPYFDQDARFDDEDAFLSMFPAGLICALEIDDSDSEYGSESSTDEDSSAPETSSVSETPSVSEKSSAASKKPIFQFAHFSVKEFFISNRMKDPFYKLEEQSGHTLILETCLSYILFVDGEFQEISSITEEDFPLLLYACICWHCHRRSLQAEATYPLVEELFQRWLNSPSTLQIWLRFGLADINDNFLNSDRRSGTSDFNHAHFLIYYDSISAYQNHIPDSGVAISWLAFLGMNQELKAVQEFTRSAACNLIKSNEENANEAIGGVLHAASLCGKLPVMRQLLDWDLDINIIGGRYGTALQAAAADGNKAMVDLLLNMGADPNGVGRIYPTALQAAANVGNKAIVELLLDMGADPNGVGGIYGTALHAAANVGNKAIVELLLDMGADPNGVGGIYGTALHAAANVGNKAIVELLLDIGADATIVSECYGTALQAPAAEGHKDVVELLLEQGSDANIVSGRYGTASQAAAKMGHVDILETLYDHGADLNAIGGAYGTVSQAAAHARNYPKVFEFLLKHNCDFTIGTPLHEAARLERLSLMQLLLDQGCDIDGINADGLTPLQVAATFSTESVAWLLKNGCNIHAISRNGETALQLAAWFIDLENTEKLLEAGASVDPVAGEQGSSLLAIINSRYLLRERYHHERLKILDRLLEKGASSEHIQRALEEARLQAAQCAVHQRAAHKFYTKIVTMLEKAKED